ncbi:group 1 glycosyl transferase [Tepidicaulis marinus]|uniref:Group 1 glycosyl transferase n=1 Tax=Tepidicaulis marinus TaxID=1333998 RepID=A0A081BDQ3_9HYPH|nr:glycosyltransferase family 4 protein [Tepidicaulis marinus]GAK46171.1 group 1 glycosyl transferase [Tepidicaulis marinus]
MNYALVAYPLSRDYRQKLESTLGYVPQYLTVAELRREPLGQLLRRLRKLNARCLVMPLEDVNSRALLPILCGLAAISNAKHLEIVQPDLSRKPLSRMSALGSLVQGAFASISGFTAAFRCNRELDKLLSESRQQAAKGEGEVLYLKTNLWFGVKAGGSVGHVAGVVNALVRRGRKVRFLSAEPPVMVDSSVEFQPIAPPAVYGLPSELNLYRFQRIFQSQALEIVKGRKIAMIYQRLSLANYAGVALSRLLRVPLVIEYNGSEAWVQKNWGRPLRYHNLAVKAEDACLRHAHAVVTISDVLRDELIERGVAPERIATYPNCIEPAVFDPARFSSVEKDEIRRSYGIDPQALVVTFIGTFGQWHGVEVLAKAIRQLVNESAELLERKKVHFMLIGDGLKFSQVQEELAGEKYQAFVTLTGLIPQDQAPSHLFASDILVSPHIPNEDGSRFFGSPTKLFEYMAMEKPIIASDLDQIGEVLRGSPHISRLKVGDSLPREAMAILTQPGSVAELADSIRYLLDNPQQHSMLGIAARKEALSRYTWDRHVVHILEVLERSVAGER